MDPLRMDPGLRQCAKRKTGKLDVWSPYYKPFITPQKYGYDLVFVFAFAFISPCFAWAFSDHIYHLSFFFLMLSDILLPSFDLSEIIGCIAHAGYFRTCNVLALELRS